MSVDVRPPTSSPPQPGPPGAAKRGSAWRGRLARLDVKASPYLFISPFFIVFLIFGAFPAAFTLWVSLHDWELLGGTRPFIGLDNYTELLKDEQFWNAVENTFGMFVLTTVPQLVIALLLANWLNRKLRASTFFRIGIIFPLATSTAAVAVVFSQLYATDYGLINWMLGLVGIDNIDWHAERYLSWVAIASMVNWRWTGYNALIYLAAMQSIPKDLYEAAAIDGASRRRQFWQITVPMLRPTIIFTVIISTIGGLQLFTEPVLFDQTGKMDGGTQYQFQTVAMYMFDSSIQSDDYGYGAAIAWVLFLLIIIFSLVNFLIIRRMGGTK
jgi:cellobiose transport system permease protein